MGLTQFYLIVCLLCLAVNFSSAEEEKEEASTTTFPSVTNRNGRKYIPLHEASGDDFNAYGPQASPRALPQGNYLPYRNVGNGVMKKSGTNVNWSVWKGDDNNNGDEVSDETTGPSRWPMPPPPPSNWNHDPWAVDPTYLMALKNAMADIKSEQKPTGFLAKLGSDPALLLIAASIPISLLLAAVLPAVMNMLMNGNNVPTITTTATGNKGRNGQQVDIMPYLTPFMEAIGTFGVKSISNPDCMQRIFCQVAHENVPAIRSVAGIARFVASGNFLEDYGIKDLVDSIGNGKCENIPCSNSKGANKKFKYSRKLDEDPAEKH